MNPLRPEPGQTSPGGRKPLRVLVIDDDAATLDFVTALLKAANCEVHAAEGGEAGLRLAAAVSPDVVVLDVMMPHMDGYMVCRLLRDDLATSHIPVIMLTGADDPALNRKAYAAGAQACVPKPFRREGLIAAMQAVVAGVPRTQT